MILNKIPIPGSYPTNPPSSYGKPILSKTAILSEDDPLVPERIAQEEEEETSDDMDEDEELDEESTPTTMPWTSPPLVAGQYSPPPTIDEATAALKDIRLMLRPLRASGIGYKDPKLDSLLRSQLEMMRMFLWNYIDPSNKTHG